MFRCMYSGFMQSKESRMKTDFYEGGKNDDKEKDEYCSIRINS